MGALPAPHPLVQEVPTSGAGTQLVSRIRVREPVTGACGVTSGRGAVSAAQSPSPRSLISSVPAASSLTLPHQLS